MPLVIDPPVTDRVSDAEYRTAQYLAAERGRVNHGADVAHEKVRDRVFPGFDVASTSANAVKDRVVPSRL